MKVTLSWLKEFLPLIQSPEEIAEALTLAGLEVDGVETLLEETIFDISLTPNLGHCMSVLGVARELSAAFNLPLKKSVPSVKASRPPSSFSIVIDSPGKCLRYACSLIHGIHIAPSPDWMIKRLEACGIHPVNQAVDIGNYVMLELGQPLHMFDAETLSGSQIIVRAAVEIGEIITIDGQKRSYFPGTLLIWDKQKPIALAGLMGDFSSAISETTQSVLIEAAFFTPEAVRWTSKKLNLRTDSSLRFERGVDPEGLLFALNRATALFQEIAGGSPAYIIDKIEKSYQAKEISCSMERINKLLGTSLSRSEIPALLKRLEFNILKEEEDRLLVAIPSYRHDLQAEIDLVEEVGRLYGFQNIPPRRPMHISSTTTHAPLYLFEEQMRALLMNQGLQELLTCNLISPTQAKETLESSLGEEALIHVLHPASIDQSVLRPTLLPGLLEAVRFNLDRGNDSLVGFEVGNIHFKNRTIPLEKAVAGMILTGNAHPYDFAKGSREVDFFDLKGHVEDLLEALHISDPLFLPSHLHSFHPRQQAYIYKGELTLGSLGQVHPQHLTPLGITQPIFFAQLSLDALMEVAPQFFQVSSPSFFPKSQRDWTVTLKRETPVGDLLQVARALNSSIIETITLRALYQSEKLGPDRKNATLRFIYRSHKKTLSFEEVETEHKYLIQELEKKLADHVVLE